MIRRRLFGLAVVAASLGGCATAEDYLSSINPFRRTPPPSAAEPAPVPAVPSTNVPSTALPPPRPAGAPPS